MRTLNLTIIVTLICVKLSMAAIEIPLTFTSDGLTFSGTLTLPDGDGPFPVAIYAHGSGPNDRDQTVTLSDANSQCLYPCLYGKTIKNFRDIANSLAENGIASFRYDKRTFSHAQALDQKAISPYDMIRDLDSAIDFIRTRPEVDLNRIYLVGHSKGVNNIAIVAGHRSDIKALIAIAGTARPIDSILTDQIRYIYKTCVDPVQAETVAQQVADVFAKMRKGEWPSNQPFMGVYPKFWLEWIGITDSAVIHYNLIQLPVLFIQGNADFNIPVENALRFQNQVKRANVKTVILDSVNHFLTYPCEPNVARPVTDTVVDFLKLYGSASGVKPSHMPTGLNIKYTDSGIIVASGPSNPFRGRLYLLDMTGRIQAQYFFAGTELLIPTSSLAKGTYILKPGNGGVDFTKKFVVK